MYSVFEVVLKHVHSSNVALLVYIVFKVLGFHTMFGWKFKRMYL